MNFEKIKEMLKNKKVQIIAGTVVGVLVLTSAGTMLLNNKTVENKNIAIEKDVNKDNKDVKEKLEELKKTDTSNLSDEEKNDLENKIEETEKKIPDDNNGRSTEEVSSGTSNSASNSTSRKDDSTKNNSTNNNNNNGTVQNKPNDNDTSASNKHTHSWTPITSVVHHDEEGHYENVLVKDAWIETVPVYETQARDICNTCNADLTGTNISAHVKQHMMAGEDKGGHRTEWKEVQVGTETIKHDAVYEKKWIVDKAAWDETVTNGYKCSSCGETK